MRKIVVLAAMLSATPALADPIVLPDPPLRMGRTDAEVETAKRAATALIRNTMTRSAVEKSIAAKKAADTPPAALPSPVPTP